MKYLIVFFLLGVFSGDKNYRLINQPIPEISGETLGGKKIDKAFFKGKVTLVNFMALGCQPCMKELPFLHELDSVYRNNNFQVLCIAPHSRERLQAFNSDVKSAYSGFRKAIGVELIKVNLLPECEISKKEPSDDEYHLTLNHDCETISVEFDVEAYPMTFIVDKEGIIRKIEFGYPMGASDTIYKQGIIKEIETWLQ